MMTTHATDTPARGKGTMASRRKPKEERQPNEHYPTDPRVAECAIALLRRPAPGRGVRVLDIGSGSGVWGAALRKVWAGVPIELYGVDIAMRPTQGRYNFFVRANFLQWCMAARWFGYFDVIMGNLPFEIAEPCIQGALPLLKPDAQMIQLLPSEFRGAKGRGNGLFQVKPYTHEYQLISRLDFIGGSGDMRWHSLFWWDNTAPVMRDRFGRSIVTMSWIDWKTDMIQPTLFEEAA
jgi:SAM-dependent methyltransferase